MKNPLKLIHDKLSQDNLLDTPGDTFSATVTKTNRKVVKLHKKEQKSKWSATQYPNGTIVETRSKKAE